jgi:hypothetical protein
MPEVVANCGAFADTDGDGAGNVTERRNELGIPANRYRTV